MARFVVALHRVLTEDPWRTEPIEIREFGSWDGAREYFLQVLQKLEDEGFECFDHGSAWAMLCARPIENGSPGSGTEKRFLVVRIEE